MARSDEIIFGGVGFHRTALRHRGRQSDDRLILWTSFASGLRSCSLLARALRRGGAGPFFKPFARSTGEALSVFSVVTIGVLSAAACLFTLDGAGEALIVIQIMTQFVAQVLAVPLIRRFLPPPRHRTPVSKCRVPAPGDTRARRLLYILRVSGLGFHFGGTQG